MKIALIGAGPRNLMALDRIFTWNNQQHWNDSLEIQLFDPFGVGGRVWDPDQDFEFKMNSLASKITLYTDESIQMRGAVHPGPTLLEWAISPAAADFIANASFKYKKLLLREITQLDEHSYSSRSLFGAYQKWYFEQIIAQKVPNVEVKLQTETVSNVTRNSDGSFIVITDTKARQFDVISAALGEGKNKLSPEEFKEATFAQDHDLKYIPISYPAEVDLDEIDATENVIIRGLGLSFIDYLSALTERRGGTFERKSDGTLVYHRSGDEPTIYAGSRRGLPYHARGFDQKAVGETSPRQFFNDQLIDYMIQNHEQMSGEHFIRLVHAEVEFTYYKRLIENNYPKINLANFITALTVHPEDFTPVLDSYGIESSSRLNWSVVRNPLPNLKSTDEFTEFIKQYLQTDVDLANAGNKTAPFTSALEKLRELRTNIRKVVTHKLINNDDYVNIFLKSFNGTNTFLAVGPPAFRIEQVLALIKASVLTLIGPDMRIDHADEQFITYSGTYNDHTYAANVLIEGRLPTPDARQTNNQLLVNLLDNGLATLYNIELNNGTSYPTGAIQVDIDTAELIDINHQPVKNFFLWGLSTEQQHWLTNGSPIPGVNDVRLRMADLVAAQVNDLIEQNSNKTI